MSFVIRTREVGTSELAKVFNGGSIIRPRCVQFAFLCGRKSSEPYLLSIDANSGAVFSWNIERTLKPTGVIRLFGAIREILRTSSHAEIFASIVQWIKIYMVYILIRLQYFTMHQDSPISVGVPDSDVAIPRLGIQCGPIELGKIFIIARANQCVLPTCERNYTVGWIKRLDNIMSWHGAFHKEPSFLVRLSAALSICNSNHIMMGAI